MSRVNIVGALCFFILGTLCGAGGFYAYKEYKELPYRDRVVCVFPLDGDELVVRNDARGKGAYGAPRSGGRKHRGVDFLAPLGSPVYAVRAGLVLEAKNHKGLGNYVRLLHKDGVTSLYAHLDFIEVQAGERIMQGAVIGGVGRTGNAKYPGIEPHLHFQMEKNGTVFDPAEAGLVYRNPLEDS